MNRVLKGLTGILLALIIVPVFTFFAYDALVFQPMLPKIRTILADAATEDRTPPVIVRRLIEASYSKGSSPATSVTRILLLTVYSEKRVSNLRRIFREIILRSLISIHLNEEEVIGIYSSMSHNGTDYGLNNFSLREFGKPLSKLSAKEAATVVAMTWAPSYYRHNPARLAVRRDMLLAKVRHGP